MPKDSVTIRLQSDLIDSLEDEAEEQDVSRSEYIRQILRDRDEIEELRDEVDTLRERLESREERISELEEQLARRSQLEDKVDTLANQEDDPEPPFFVKWYRWWNKKG
jgi:chromosome segregation ATPase